MEKDDLNQESELEQQNTKESEEETSEEETEEATQEDTADYKKIVNIQNRLLEKEGYEFKEGKWVKVKTKTEKPKENDNLQSETLSAKDLIAIQRADIHEDDLDEVTNYAKFKNLGIADALKDSSLKSILKDRAEYRKSEEVANSKGASPKQSKTSGADLLSRASKGRVPTDDADIEKLANAHLFKNQAS